MEDSDTPDTLDTARTDDELEGDGKLVFISYHWDCQATVLLIRDRLISAGFSLWADEDDVRGSVLDEVAADIDRSGAVLVSLSHKYKENPNCRAQAEYAHGIDKPIIPLRLEQDCEADGWLEPVCGDSLVYDFSDPENYEDSLHRLISALQELGLAAGSNAASDHDEYKELFAKFDRDGNGAIDPTELGDALRYIGCNPTDREVEAMICEADSKVNGNGRLEYSEFCDIIAMHKKSIDEEEQELRQAFRLFDKNGDGTIDREELKKTVRSVGVWEAMSEEEIDELMDAADTDHSGRIEYNELVRVIVGR
jgi:calmodulin